MRLAVDSVRGHSGVGASQDDGEIAALRPGARAIGVDHDILHAEVTGFDVDE